MAVRLGRAQLAGDDPPVVVARQLGLVLDAVPSCRRRLEPGVADRLAAALAAAVPPVLDALQRSVELDQLGLEVTHQALIQFTLEGLGGELGGVLLRGGELTL